MHVWLRLCACTCMPTITCCAHTACLCCRWHPTCQMCSCSRQVQFSIAATIRTHSAACMTPAMRHFLHERRPPTSSCSCTPHELLCSIPRPSPLSPSASPPITRRCQRSPPGERHAHCAGGGGATSCACAVGDGQIMIKVEVRYGFSVKP